MFLSTKSGLFRLKNKISLLTTLLAFSTVSSLQAQEGCCPSSDPNEKQNLVVGSVAIALVGIGVAVALSGKARNNLSNCSSYLYTYSGGLTDWSSSSSYSDYSCGSCNISSSSSNSDKKTHHQESHLKTIVENQYMLPTPLPKELNIIVTNFIDNETETTVIAPNGHANHESMISHGDSVAFSYDEHTISSGIYRFTLASSEELPSGTELGKIEISDSSGAIVEQIDIVVP